MGEIWRQGQCLNSKGAKTILAVPKSPCKFLTAENAEYAEKNIF